MEDGTVGGRVEVGEVRAGGRQRPTEVHTTESGMRVTIVGTCEDEESPYFSCTLEGRVYPVGGKFPLGVRASANGTYDMEYDACDMEDLQELVKSARANGFSGNVPLLHEHSAKKGPIGMVTNMYISDGWLHAMASVYPPKAMRSATSSVRCFVRRSSTDSALVTTSLAISPMAGRIDASLKYLPWMRPSSPTHTAASKHPTPKPPPRAPWCLAHSTPSHRMAASSTG